MITINDLKPTIFTELEKIAPNLKLFEIIGSGQELDDLYIFKYGNRLTSDNLDSAKTANYMKMLYSGAWDSAYYLFQGTQNILPDLGRSDIKTIIHQYKYTDSTNDVNAVPSFDSTELNTETQRDSTFTHDTISGDNVDKTTETNDNKDINDFQKSYEFLMLNWVDDIIFNDVNRFITMYIHN